MSTIHQAGPVDTTEFRKLMSLFATGVCVVSFAQNSEDDTGGISGMTINSLVSVSLEPTLICWSLHNDSSQFEDYVGAQEFAISILADGQQTIARRYAARGDTALNRDDFDYTARGLPVIRGALATIECKLWEAYPAGDHTMILGEVAAMQILGPAAEPIALGFFGGRFCAIPS